MADLSAFPITARWPAKHPDMHPALFAADAERREGIDRAGRARPALRAALVDIGKNESWTPEFLSLNPNGKIPAIIDPDGPGGKPIGLFESGAILLYLADKTGKLMPADPARRYETIQWVFFQMAAIGPMFGQVGFFHKFAGKEIEDKRPLDRYRDESKRLLGVLETRLDGPRVDHGRRLHHRRHLDARLGAQPDRLLRGARTGRLRRLPQRRGLARTRPGAAGGAARPEHPGARLSVQPARGRAGTGARPASGFSQCSRRQTQSSYAA